MKIKPLVDRIIVLGVEKEKPVMPEMPSEDMY
jgi:co-chaperonin GroES (HSP10)